MPPIPDFLLVENRRPAPAGEAFAASTPAPRERTDWRKPKGMPWEEWDEHLARTVDQERARTRERIDAMRSKLGVAPRRARSATTVIAGLLTRPGGCVARDVLDATGWRAVSMPRQARTAGLELRRESVDGVTRYYGVARTVG